MKKTYSLLALLTISIAAFAQEIDKSKFINEGLVEVDYRQEYLECDQDYNILERVILEDGPNQYLLNKELFSGCVKIDFPENQQYYIYYIKDGLLEKQMVYYYNGLPAATFNFMEGKSHGFHRMFFDTGKKYIEEYYLNGKMDGLQRRWYPSGQLAREQYFSNGEREYDKYYEPDGELKE